MRLRLTGTRAECEQFLAALRTAEAGAVGEVSAFYLNRGTSQLGRVYLELTPPPLPTPDQSGSPA